MAWNDSCKAIRMRNRRPAPRALLAILISTLLPNVGCDGAQVWNWIRGALAGSATGTMATPGGNLSTATAAVPAANIPAGSVLGGGSSGSPVVDPRQTAGTPGTVAAGNGSGGIPSLTDGAQPAGAGGTLLKKGEASWYDEDSTTSTGEPFDPEKITAAMFGNRKVFQARVVNLANGKEVVVRVNDNGPFAVDSRGKAIRPLRAHPTRVIDLSRAAFRAIEDLNKGVTDVEVYLL